MTVASQYHDTKRKLNNEKPKPRSIRRAQLVHRLSNLLHRQLRIENRVSHGKR